LTLHRAATTTIKDPQSVSTKYDSPDKANGSAKVLLKRSAKLFGLLVLAILAVVLVIGLIPVPLGGLESAPDPAEDYEEALRRFDKILADEEAIVNEASGSHLMTHGNKTQRVYVLIHGTTNSPLQFVELGDILHARGHNVLILRMPYHGLKSHLVSELKSLKAEDLRAYADQTIDIVVGLGDEVDVTGISGGGAVTSWIAQNRPDVGRVVLLAPFFGIAHTPFWVDTWLMDIFARMPNVVFDNPTEPRREWVYRGEASRGVAEFLRLGRAVLKQARGDRPAVNDISVVTTASDSTADNRATDRLVEIWEKSGANIESYEFDASLEIPHNSIDPAADPQKKKSMYAKILELLGEEPLH
jgi:carboxylesterase